MTNDRGNNVDLSGRRRYMRKARGFTLIELMTVIAIVGILVAIALPSYQESVRKGRRGQAKADLAELAQVLERYHTINNTYVTAAPFVNPITQSPKTGTANYNIAIQGQTANTFIVVATPVAGTSQANDRCGTLAIDQAGRRWHSIGDDDQCQFGQVGPP